MYVYIYRVLGVPVVLEGEGDAACKLQVQGSQSQMPQFQDSPVQRCFFATPYMYLNTEAETWDPRPLPRSCQQPSEKPAQPH